MEGGAKDLPDDGERNQKKEGLGEFSLEDTDDDDMDVETEADKVSHSFKDQRLELHSFALNLASAAPPNPTPLTLSSTFFKKKIAQSARVYLKGEPGRAIKAENCS